MDEVYKANDNPTVQEILDNLMTIREYAQAPEGQRPVIWVGEKDSYAGKTVVDFAGGLGAELDELKALITAGVGTFVCMHMDATSSKPCRRTTAATCCAWVHGQRLHWL